MFRTATLESAPAASAEGRAVKLSISSEALVLRKDGVGLFYERLSHQPGDCNLALFNRAGVVLRDHLEKEVIGTVEPNSFVIHPDRKLRGVVTLTDAAWISKLNREDIPVSCGYTWISLLREEPHQTNGLPVRTYSWMPYECSLLTGKPADGSVGIGRSADSSMKNIDQLLTLALSGTRQTEDDFSGASLAEVLDFKTPPRGLCRQMQDAAPAGCGGDVITGRWLSFDALAPHRRDLTVGGTGGNLVQQDMTGILGVLKNRCAAVDLGATVISGLQGDFVLPLATTSALTVESLSEIQQASVSDLTTAQRIGRPHRCTIQIKVSKQLLLQSPATEPFLRSEFLAQFAVAVDRLVFFGGQNPAEPIGILNTPGVASEVFGGPPTWPAVLKFEKALSDANADIGSLGWALAPATRNAWKQVSRSGSYPSFIMENDKVNSYPTSVTNTLAAANQAVFGNWSDLLILVWGNGAEIIRDPFTHAGSAETVFTANLWLDVMLRRPQSFVVSADSANQ